MRARFLSLPVLLALCAPGAARAQEAPLTVRDAMREAVRANPGLIALRREYESVRASIPAARALDAPMFETQIWGWPVTTINPSKTDMYMFMTEQALPGRGKRAARELVATRDGDVSRQQIAVRANVVLNQVKQAYAELVLARATADLYGRQKPLLEDTAEAATLQYAAGHTGQHDTVKSIVELSRLQTDTVEWRERERVAATQFNVLLGRAPDAAIPALALTETTTLPAVADAERLAVERNPDVSMAATEIAREEAELNRLRGEKKPDFVVAGGYMLQPGEAGAWTARAGLTWPNAPWSRKGLDAQIDAQEKRVTAARARRDAAIIEVRRNVHEAMTHAEAARERMQLLESTVIPHIEHAFEVARSEYVSSRGEYADLLDTQRELLAVRMQVVAAHADLARAVGDLELALGAAPEEQ